METLITVVAWGVIIFVITMALVSASKAVGKGKERALQVYLEKNFPDLPADINIFAAKQRSKAAKLDIALIIDDNKKEIILLLDKGGARLKNKTYSFADLINVNSTEQVNSSGVVTKSFSYERTLAISFKDRRTYSFINSFPSNITGDDKGSEVIKESFAPWEAKLKKILK